MPELDSDTFTYSDGVLATVSSGKWEKLSGMADMTVVSNEVHATDEDCVARIAAWSGHTTDHYAECKISNSQSDNGGPVLRANGTSTYYYIRGDGTGNGVNVFKVVSGSFTSIHADAGSYAINDVIRGEIVGTTITVKKNGTELYSPFTDSAISSAGRPGIGGFNALGRLNDWAAGDFAAGAAFLAANPTMVRQAVNRAGTY